MNSKKRSWFEEMKALLSEIDDEEVSKENDSDEETIKLLTENFISSGSLELREEEQQETEN